MGSMGQSSLIDYGIQTDESDYRAHVGFGVGAVYFFPTVNGKLAIQNMDKDKLRTATQQGVKHITAKGYLVPWQSIMGIQEIDIPQALLGKANCKKGMSISEKGRKAVWTVRQMLLSGLIPITLSAREVKEQELQIRGEDIIITASASIQVKCDFKAGNRGRGGTGNIFLQIAECNPLRRY